MTVGDVSHETNHRCFTNIFSKLSTMCQIHPEHIEPTAENLPTVGDGRGV